MHAVPWEMGSASPHASCTALLAGLQLPNPSCTGCAQHGSCLNSLKWEPLMSTLSFLPDSQPVKWELLLQERLSATKDF